MSANINVSATMAPHERKRVTLRELRKARKQLMGDAYLDELETKPEQTQREAATTLQRVAIAITRLDDALLKDIRDQLAQNEAELGAATQDMVDALEELKKTREVLSAVADVLGVVGRIVALF